MIKESVEIHAPQARVFQLSQDYSKRLLWDSFLIEARLIDASEPGVGVRSFCRAWNGIGIETEYVTFNAPSVVAIKMTKGPWLFKEFAATWRFQKTDECHTQVTFIYHFKTRLIPEALMSLIVSREMKRRLRDLKRYSESHLQRS